MAATLEDLIKVLGLAEKDARVDSHAYGEVKAINQDKTYQVSLNGSNTTVKCARLAGAKVGDTVLVTILANGYAVVTGTVGGDTDAADALVEASEAKTLAEATNQYFWFMSEGSDTGAHITEVPQEDFLQNPELGGGNLLARSSGIALRNGLREIARFSGAGGAAFMGISPLAMEVKNTAGAEVFHIDFNKGTVEAEINVPGGEVREDIYWMNERIRVSGSFSSGDNLYLDLGINITFAASSAAYICTCNGDGTFECAILEYWGRPYILNGSFDRKTFVYGTPSTQTLSLSIYAHSGATLEEEKDLTITIEYDGTDTFDITGVSVDTAGHIMYWSGEIAGNIKYIDNTTAPAYALGIRSGDAGMFSSVIGRELYAEGDYQTAIGKFNEQDPNHDYAFAIGNGNAVTRSNAFAVDWDGIPFFRNPNNAFRSVFDLIYPVGSIYMNVNNVDPGLIFGGTWERITGRFLLAATDNGATGTNVLSNASVAPGASGGEASHVITTGEMAAHTHGSKSLSGKVDFRDIGTGNTEPYGWYYTASSAAGIISRTTNTWSGSHANFGASTTVTNPKVSTMTINATHEHTSVGSGTAHNNMPPFLAVYVWKRTT